VACAGGHGIAEVGIAGDVAELSDFLFGPSALVVVPVAAVVGQERLERLAVLRAESLGLFHQLDLAALA